MVLTRSILQCSLRILVAAAVCCAALAQAQPTTPSPLPSTQFQISLSGDLDQLARRFTQPARTLSVSSAPPSIAGTFLSYGPGVVTFKSERRRDWRATFRSDGGEVEDTSALLLLSGELRPDSDPKSTVPVAGSIYEEGGVAMLHIAMRDQAGTANPNTYMINVPLDPDARVASASLTATPLSALSGVLCGSEGVKVPAGVARASAPQSAQVGIQAIRTMDLASDADYEWYQAYGVNANNRIATLINAVNVAYERDVELTIHIIRQNVWTTASDPYVSSDSGTSLTEFQNYTNTNSHLGAADDYHLFTGKDLDGGTIGIAYVGVVCAYPTYSFGVTQKFNDSADWIVLAHEIGHNLNAAHDDATPNTIMNAYVSLSATAFSNTSKTQINAWTGTNSSCLATATSPTPTPTPTATPTPTPTAPATPTPTPTPTPSATPTPSPSATPTPSPDPTATPDPTPTPTAEPTPDPRENPPSLDLRTSYNSRRGALTFDVRVGDSGLNQCSVSLLIGENSAMGRSRSVLLDEPVQMRRYLRTVLRLPLRIRDSNPRGTSVYLQAIFDCGEGVSVESPVRRVGVPTSRDRRFPTKSSWTRAFVRALR